MNSVCVCVCVPCQEVFKQRVAFGICVVVGLQGHLNFQQSSESSGEKLHSRRSFGQFTFVESRFPMQTCPLGSTTFLV